MTEKPWDAGDPDPRWELGPLVAMPEDTTEWGTFPPPQDLRKYIDLVDQWSKAMAKVVAIDDDQRSRQRLWELAVTMWLGLTPGHMVSGTLNVIWTGEGDRRFAHVGWSSTERKRPSRGVDYRWGPDSRYLDFDDPPITQHAVTLGPGDADELLNLAGVRPLTWPPVVGRSKP